MSDSAAHQSAWHPWSGAAARVPPRHLQAMRLVLSSLLQGLQAHVQAWEVQQQLRRIFFICYARQLHRCAAPFRRSSLITAVSEP